MSRNPAGLRPATAGAVLGLRWGRRPVSVQGGIRYWVTSPDGGPEGLGLRAALTFMFPKK